MQDTNQNLKFNKAAEMPYASSLSVTKKASRIFGDLKRFFALQKSDSKVFIEDEYIYIPDIHGDFVHLALTLYRHGLIDDECKLLNSKKYVFLGDIYDRAPDADVVDYWLNTEIASGKEIYRIIGNHELAFFLRGNDGIPIIFPSQDSIKDSSNGFRITEELLRNIASGNILAAYVDMQNTKNSLNTLYVHSYVIDNDFVELGLPVDADICLFVQKANERFRSLGEKALDIFQSCKKSANYRWKDILDVFHSDPLFSFYGSKNDIDTSFVWRRTGLPLLKTYPVELDVHIPDNVYQIVGHTPVFLFNLPSSQSVNVPFVLNSSAGSGRVQFSDVGIGYHYRSNDLDRPHVAISKNQAVAVKGSER